MSECSLPTYSSLLLWQTPLVKSLAVLWHALPGKEATQNVRKGGLHLEGRQTLSKLLGDEADLSPGVCLHEGHPEAGALCVFPGGETLGSTGAQQSLPKGLQGALRLRRHKPGNLLLPRGG